MFCGSLQLFGKCYLYLGSQEAGRHPSTTPTCLKGAGRAQRGGQTWTWFCFSSLRRCAFSQHGCQEQDAGNMVAFVKSDPLSVPWARHDLIKACLPLVGAAVFKSSLKTPPRWPQASPSWAGWSPLRRDGFIDHKSSWFCGSSLHPFQPRALGHWSCRVWGWNLRARGRPG